MPRGLMREPAAPAGTASRPTVLVAVVLEVTDRGAPPLTSYRRVIIGVR